MFNDIGKKKRKGEYIYIYTIYDIRRPESACSSNNLLQNPKSKIQNPKSKIQNPRSKIKNPKSKIQDPKSKIQNPKSKIQNPKSKRPRLGLPQKEWILRQSKIQNPKSKIQNPKSKIQDPKSKIQNPGSKIQNPKSKQPVWILDFGVWIWVARLGWLCSKRSCMEGLATQIWRSWWGLQLVSKRSEARFPPCAGQIGHRFPEGGFAGNGAPISSPVLWKLGANFQKDGGELRCAKQLFYGFNFVNAGTKRK